MKSVKFTAPKSDNAFYEETKQAINEYFTKNNTTKFANSEMLIKIVLWISLWAITWASIILLKDNFLLAFFAGLAHMFCHVMIAFNITHDANHNAMFSNTKLNNFLGYFLELLGCNRKMWSISHNQEHHTFINIHEHDNNIEGYKLLRLCPQDQWLSHHKYQWLYAPFIYALSTFNYATLRDFKMLLRYKQLDKFKLTFAFLAEFIFFKILYYSYLFIIPIFVFGVSFKIVLAYFFVGHAINGLFLALLFIVGHLTEGTTFPELENSNVNANWAMHVVSTTGDFSTKTNIMQWLVGGINLHVAHHLFPKICHVHYKAITPIIKNVAAKHGLEYREITTFGLALKSHFSLLKTLGENSNRA